MRSRALEYDVLLVEAVLQELGERLRVGELERRAEGAGEAGDDHVRPFLLLVGLAQSLAAALAFRVSRPQRVAVNITAIRFVEQLDVPSVLAVDLIGRCKQEPLGIAPDCQIKHILRADDVGRYRADGIRRISDRMRVAGEVEDIVSVEADRHRFRLVHVAFHELEERGVPGVAEALPAFLGVPAQGDNLAAQSFFLILVHDGIHKQAADHARGAGKEDGGTVHLVPRNRFKAGNQLEIFLIKRMFVHAHFR